MNLSANGNRRKRLGQFFTGELLGRVLAALAQAREAQTIVDPMGGRGDLLLACLEIGALPKLMAALELDPEAAQACSKRLAMVMPSAVVVAGDAFDRRTWTGLPDTWDLVITNPPYVRYQTAATGSGEFPALPSARRIRSSLIELIGHLENLDDAEAQTFAQCVEGYSGLADLAVPSWLLCCARVPVGGRVAIVAPATWMSRDYAIPVLYILRRFFEIEFVVEDSDAAWFDEALVRTTLVVARRIADRGSALLDGGHLLISLAKAAADDVSLVGRAFPGEVPEIRFAEWVRALRDSRQSNDAHGIRAIWSDESDLIQVLKHAASRYSWLGGNSSGDKPRLIPERLRASIGRVGSNLASLAEMGWSVGQGLRTGANDFFYVTEADGTSYSAILPGEPLSLPASVTRASVRRQADLLERESGRPPNSRSRVLLLGDWALPEDMAKAQGPRPWRPMEGDLGRLVRVAEQRTYVRASGSVPLPELSAVRTNVYRYDVRRPSEVSRFWYQLPPLAERHQPALFMPRINHSSPGVFVNRGRELIIDANFSSLWPSNSGALNYKALAALLCSSWTQCFLEMTGAVLGAGALKVEATHLRRLLLPRPDQVSIRELSRLVDEAGEFDLRRISTKEIDEIVSNLLEVHAGKDTTARLARDLVQARQH